jgi:hypothetical protein
MAGEYVVEAENAEYALEIVQRLPDSVQPADGFTVGQQNIDEDGIEPYVDEDPVGDPEWDIMPDGKFRHEK